MEPEKLSKELRKAKKEGKDFVFFRDNDGYYHMKKIADLDLEKPEIYESVISFEVKFGKQFYNMDLMEKIYVANEIT